MLLLSLVMSPGLTGYSHQHVIAPVTDPSSGLDLTVSDIKSIRAYTDLCWYGQKLTMVDITYRNDVDLSGVSPDTYTLLDRGYANPDFAEVIIESVDVNGQVVTLNITVDTEALRNNALIYSGDNATGVRTKNPIGLYATGPWYRSVDGIIHYGEEDSEKYKANTSGDGYQTRACLELKLFHSGETEADAACLANQDGTYNADGLWLPTIDANYGEDGFQTFEALGIQVPTSATDGDLYVRGWAFFPADFDRNRHDKYPLIITITGYGTSYWKHEDGTNNFGTGLNFDGSGFRWMDCGAIVLNIHDRSHTGGEDYKFYVDDYNVIQYFIQNYNADPEAITLTGNSRGTIACNTIAATYPGLINTLILNNGSMGTGVAGKNMFEGTWTDQEWQDIAKYGTSIWVFDGEQDTNNKENFGKAVSYYKEAGWSDDWIAENIRLTGFPSGLYHYWGDTDHSTTKMTYWYFFDKPYYGPDAKIVDGELVYNTRLKKGDTYQLKGRMVDGKYNKEGFNYIIYGENLRDWVLSREYEKKYLRKFTPVSLDNAPIPDYDYQRANKLPMTGYFEKSFNINGNPRSAKFYIASNAPIRSFFTVIAVPESVRTTEFMVTSGWHAIADRNEEGLVLLEPGNDGWGDPSMEQEYINAVLDFYKANEYFSIFGISYFVGYEGGGTALEAWAAAHPLMVISQAYINSESQSDAYYNRFKDMYLDGSSSGYVNIEIPDEYRFTYDDIPVPTAFIHSDMDLISRGIAYWKEVNDVETRSNSTTDYFFGADVFTQSTESRAWATAYTGAISKVVTLESNVSALNPSLTDKLYDFITEYVSYDNTTAYGNHLAIRKKYGDIGTMIVNGELREFQIYVPEAAERMWPEGAPVVFVFAGNSQTDKVFFHNTLWWKVADNEGFILAIPCETYSRSSTSVSHANTGMFYEKLAGYLKSYYHVDPTRFYATGQSAGSFATQEFGVTNPGYFAAIASTSGLSYPGDEGGFGRVSRADASYEMIPNYCIIGQGDIEMMTGTLWDDTENMLDEWAAYYLEANGVGPLGDGSNVETEGRFITWTWSNDQGFPLFKVGQTLYRAHNCIPAEMPLLWNFMKHWSYKDGVRFYDGAKVE